MAKAILYQWSVQDSLWKEKKSSIVEESKMTNTFEKSNKLSNQSEEYFFYKFDCYKDDNSFLGSILTLNIHLFI